jgi:hypothetical protein
MSTLCTLRTLQAHCAYCAHYAHCAPLSILGTLCTLRAHCAYCAHFVHCAPLSTLCRLCTLHPKEIKFAQVCTIKDPSASMLPAGLWHQNLAGCSLPVATILPMHPGKAVLQNKIDSDRHSVHTRVHLLHSNSLGGTELERRRLISLDL